MSVKVNVCFDSGAGISSCRLPATLIDNKDIKPIGQRRATLITVAGRKSESFDIFGVTVKTKDCTFHIECYLMQNLPYPTVRHDLREAVRAAGYESLPSQHQLSEQAYVLLLSLIHI